MSASAEQRAGTHAARAVALPPPALKPLRAFRWLDVRPLWTSRNDVLARALGDPTDDLRKRWLELLPSDGGERSLVVTRDAGRDRTSFTVAGDTGEGDCSQEVAARTMLALQERSDFLLIASDVVYPAGDVNEYQDKFYEPYADWTKPVFAIPGNHDWYDELQGFMFHFCDVEPPKADGQDTIRRPWLWRAPRPPTEATRQRHDAWRGRHGPPQPGPYFAIDAGPVAIIGIDTGITGTLDREQGEWLMRVSRELTKPKILVTGKPLLVDGRYEPGRVAVVDWTIDSIVRDPHHGYVAAIGGDIHNYQRYPVQLEDGRCLQYVVAGGGGAFMHATHRIGEIELGDTVEADFRCFPLRGDSLAFYSRAVVPALRRLMGLATGLPVAIAVSGASVATQVARATRSTVAGVVAGVSVFGLPLAGSVLLLRHLVRSGVSRVTRLRTTTLTPEEASAYLADEAGVSPTVSASVTLDADKRALAEFVQPRAMHARGVLHRYFSEIFDVDKPPLYKHALHVEADRDTLTIRCYAATGTEGPGGAPLLEDEVRIPLGPARDAMGA